MVTPRVAFPPRDDVMQQIVVNVTDAVGKGGGAARLDEACPPHSVTRSWITLHVQDLRASRTDVPVVLFPWRSSESFLSFWLSRSLPASSPDPLRILRILAIPRAGVSQVVYAAMEPVVRSYVKDVRSADSAASLLGSLQQILVFCNVLSEDRAQARSSPAARLRPWRGRDGFLRVQLQSDFFSSSSASRGCRCGISCPRVGLREVVGAGVASREGSTVSLRRAVAEHAVKPRVKRGASTRSSPLGEDTFVIWCLLWQPSRSLYHHG